MPMWCVAPLEINEENSLGARVQSAYRLQCRKSPTCDLYKKNGGGRNGRLMCLAGRGAARGAYSV